MQPGAGDAGVGLGRFSLERTKHYRRPFNYLVHIISVFFGFISMSSKDKSIFVIPGHSMCVGIFGSSVSFGTFIIS